VHFTCSDALSGIPTGACPADQTLSGIGTVASTALTVTDEAGNTSTPSNAVTVKIVNAAGLCALTSEDVKSSAKYQALRPVQRAKVPGLLNAACTVIALIQPRLTTAQRQVFVEVYEGLVRVLRRQDWLSVAQQSALDELSSGL
jgi:hypothetical protein